MRKTQRIVVSYYNREASDLGAASRRFRQNRSTWALRAKSADRLTHSARSPRLGPGGLLFPVAGYGAACDARHRSRTRNTATPLA